MSDVGPPSYGGPHGGGPYGGYYGVPYQGQPPGPPPPDHLVWAILSTVLCCMPFGVVSIVFASQVNSKWAMGDYAGAHDASRKAKMWAIVSAAATAAVGVVYLIIIAIAIAAESGAP